MARSTAGGIGRILALFCALCAGIALMVAAADAYVNTRHRQWPQVPATISDVDVREYRPFTRDGRGIRYSLEVKVNTADGARTLRSGSAANNRPFVDWINRHPKATNIAIRLDPGDSRYAELVDEEDLPMPRHPKEDLILCAAFAGTAALLALVSRVTLPS